MLIYTGLYIHECIAEPMKLVASNFAHISEKVGDGPPLVDAT